MSSSSIPFPIVEHKRYNLTFLSSVKLVVAYRGENENFEGFRDFFKSFFKIDVTKQQYDIKNADALRIRSSESEEKYKFSRNFAEVIIDGNSYIDFETSLRPFASALQGFLMSISAVVLNLKLEKVNLWPAPSKDGFSRDQLMKAIFSDNILSNTSENDDALHIKEFNLTKSDMGVSVVVKYGVVSDPDSSTVILDTICDQAVGTVADEVVKTLLKMNQLLFDAYHWAVNDEVIEVMDR